MWDENLFEKASCEFPKIFCLKKDIKKNKVNMC